MASSTSEPGVFDYLLALADDALVASQRLSGWIARAPTIEEDVALGNIALDLLGQARSLLSYAGLVEAAGRDEDALAYFRPATDFRNVQLVERPYGASGDDFGVTVVRLLLLAAYQVELYGALGSSADPTVAAVAAKAVKEVRYHRDHARQWVVRLGDGTEDSHARTATALATEWPYLGQLFTGVDAGLVRSGAAVDAATLRAPVQAYVAEVLAEATLEVPAVAEVVAERTEHTPALEELLEEMQHLARQHPGATW